MNEIVHQPGAVVFPESNPHDGTEQAYEAADKETQIKEALQGKEELPAEPEIDKNESPEEDEFKQKFTELTKREKQLRHLEQQMNDKLAALEERLQSMDQYSEPEEEPEPELPPLEYRLKKDPLTTLKEMGLGYDKLTELALNEGKLTTDMQMQLMREELEGKFGSELQSLKKELEEREKREEEKKYEQTVQSFVEEITNYVNNEDKYEMIRANDSVDLVYSMIEDYYNETGRILDIQEAADQVEDYLVEEFERIYSKTQKIKDKLGVSQKEAERIVESEEQKSIQQSPTLSNTQSAVVSKQSRPKSRDESVLHAASLLKWQE